MSFNLSQPFLEFKLIKSKGLKSLGGALIENEFKMGSNWEMRVKRPHAGAIYV